MTGTPSSFSLHERQIQDYLKGQEVLSRLITGGIAGIVGKSAIAPLERIKMIFQVTSQTYSWSSAYQKMKDIIKEGGLKSLWKGHSTTVLRVGPFAGLSYMIHDHTEEFFRSVYGSEKLPFFLKFMAGSIGGIGATVLTYPLDVLRVRLALIPESTWGTVLSRGGYFQGMSATVLGIIPYSGTGWMVKQTLMELYPHLHVRDGKPDVLGLLFINGIAGLVFSLHFEFSTFYVCYSLKFFLCLYS